MLIQMPERLRSGIFYCRIQGKEGAQKKIYKKLMSEFFMKAGSNFKKQVSKRCFIGLLFILP